MDDAELIERLRGWAKDIQEGSEAIWAMDQDLKEAADRIEALIAERDAARDAALEEAAKVADECFKQNSLGRRDLYKWGIASGAQAIAALPAAPTFTAADLERAYRLALQDAWLKASSIPAGQRTLKTISALTPPADLAQRVKGPAHD